MKKILLGNVQNIANKKQIWKFPLCASAMALTFLIINQVQGQLPVPNTNTIGGNIKKSDWEGGDRILRPSPENTRILIGKELRPLNSLHIDGIFDVELNKKENSGAIRISSGASSLRLDENEIMAVTHHGATSDLAAQELGGELHINAQGGTVHLFQKLDRKDEIIFHPGRVRIGAPSDQLPTAKLIVGGTIGAQEIIVTPDNWADDVFKPSYVLRTLGELEDFLKRNRHLPGIPSEAHVKSEGVSITEFSTGMLRNLEELTLHVISQSKAIIDQRDSLAAELLAQQENYESRIKKLEQYIQNHTQVEKNKL